MKVLHVIPSISPLRGGPTRALLSTVSSLASAGVDVHVAATDDDGPGRSPAPDGSFRQGGVEFHIFPRRTRFYTASDTLALWLRGNAPRFDLLHLHALFSFAPIAAALIAQQSRIPYVIRPLGTLNRWGRRRRALWRRLSVAALEGRILKRASAVQFTSLQELEEARDWGIPMRPFVIPNIADLPAVPPPAAANCQNVLFLSRLHPVKGLDLLLPAFAQVRREVPQARLTIAGDGDPAFVRSMQACAASLGLEDAVAWTGFVSGERRANMLADAALFVLPSYSENFGLAAAEAMAHARPVVVTDRVAIHREIARAAAGCVVPCDSRPLAAAMVSLLRKPALCLDMAGRGRRLVEECFSALPVTASLKSLYQEVIAA